MHPSPLLTHIRSLSTPDHNTIFSPPVTPQYNGAIETGNRSLKAHARLETLRHGRNVWTNNDLAAACIRTNLFARPRGQHAPNPHSRSAQCWQSRPPITAAERHHFQTTRATITTQPILEQKLCPEDLCRRAVRANGKRTATRKTLLRLAYPFVRRGPIRPPLKSENSLLIT